MLALPLAQFARMMKSNPKRDIDEEVDQKKYKGVYYRKWGKWVSEIRVPRTKERIWLGTYSTPQGAAAAHDIATYSLHGPLSFGSLNFPLMLPASARLDMTPSSIVREATDAGKAMDALMIRRISSPLPPPDVNANENNAVQGVKIEIEEDETRSEGRGSSKSVDGY